MKRQNVRSLVLVLVMMLYILLGAAIFERLESSNEITGLANQWNIMKYDYIYFICIINIITLQLSILLKWP